MSYNILKVEIFGNRKFGRKWPVANRSPAGLLARALEFTYPIL